MVDERPLRESSLFGKGDMCEGRARSAWRGEAPI
jgi:hypothetical protein